MKMIFAVEVYEYQGRIFIFPMSETEAGYFYEFPSLKISYDSPAIEIGRLVLEASKRVRNFEFEDSPFEDEDIEIFRDTGVKKYVTFINKSRYCKVRPDLLGSSKIRIAPGYRSAGGFEFGEGLFATPDDPQDIGDKVLQALKTYEPKYPKKR